MPTFQKSFEGEQKNLIEDIDSKKFDENYGKAFGVPYWVNTRCDYEDDFMKKIKTWQFNPPADEEDEWPIEPRFYSLLHSTMISDNHDNETRPHGTKMKAVHCRFLVPDNTPKIITAKNDGEKWSRKNDFENSSTRSPCYF